MGKISVFTSLVLAGSPFDVTISPDLKHLRDCCSTHIQTSLDLFLSASSVADICIKEVEFGDQLIFGSEVFFLNLNLVEDYIDAVA